MVLLQTYMQIVYDQVSKTNGKTSHRESNIQYLKGKYTKPLLSQSLCFQKPSDLLSRSISLLEGLRSRAQNCLERFLLLLGHSMLIFEQSSSRDLLSRLGPALSFLLIVY